MSAQYTHASIITLPGPNRTAAKILRNFS